MNERKPRCHRLLPALLAALSAGPAIMADAGRSVAAEPAVLHKVLDLGPHCRLATIDSVSFMDGGRRGWYLYVGGSRRFANMSVALEHRSLKGGILIVDVVGCTPNFIALPIPSPYRVELALQDIPRARRIRIVGANGQVTRRVPGR